MGTNNRVYLRAFELSDYKQLNIWRNDNDIFRYTAGNKYFISSEYDKKWVEDKLFNNQENIYLAICLTENNNLIGYLSINNIDWRNRNASWGGIVIGEKELWNKGYATEAARIMLEYVFNEMGMDCFHALWLEPHTASIKMGEKIGFKREGILRDRVFKSGRFFNQIAMSILRSEYEEISKGESN